MTNELSTERAIEALYTVRAYYASLTAGYPKGKDRRGIGDVMCSEIANSCLMAIKALEQEPVLDKMRAEIEELDRYYDNDYFSANNCPMYKCNEVLLIIDKYKAESEDEE